MAPIKIVRLDGIHTPPPTFSPSFEHTYTEYSDTVFDDNVIAERIGDADAVVSTRIPVTRAVLERCPRLKLIAVLAIGVDMIDLPACKEYGVTVCNVPAASVESVAEHAIALFLALRRNVVGMHELIAAGVEWPKRGTLKTYFGPCPGICRDEVVGIIGAGSLGQKLATICRALGMTVQIAARKNHSTSSPLPANRTSFTEVLRTSTLLFLTAPLLPETRNLLSTAEFAIMRSDALLVNVARGGIVDEIALVEALKEQKIGGAATDVYLREPAGLENALVRAVREWANAAKLAEGEKGSELGILNGRLILSPHIAWWARSSIDKLKATTGSNIEAWARGEARNTVA